MGEYDPYSLQTNHPQFVKKFIKTTHTTQECDRSIIQPDHPLQLLKRPHLWSISGGHRRRYCRLDRLRLI